MPALASRGGEFAWATADHEFFSSEPFVEDPSCPGKVPEEKVAEPCPPCAGYWNLNPSSGSGLGMVELKCLCTLGE